jgi:hypothetical protein
MILTSLYSDDSRQNKWQEVSRCMYMYVSTHTNTKAIKTPFFVRSFGGLS